MKLIKAVSSALSWIESSLIVLLLLLMTLLAFLQVVLRNVFSTSFLWGDPFLRHLVLWIGFLGASIATRQEKHINLDIVTRLLPPRATSFIRTCTNLFAAIVTALLARAGFVFLTSEIESGEALFTIGQTDVPAWWLQLIIPVGFGLMAFRFFIRVIEHAIETINPPVEIPPPVNVPNIET